jgi:hypothetical protein
MSRLALRRLARLGAGPRTIRHWARHPFARGTVNARRSNAGPTFLGRYAEYAGSAGPVRQLIMPIRNTSAYV